MVTRIIIVTEIRGVSKSAIIDLAAGGRMLHGATLTQSEAADILRPMLETYLATHPPLTSGSATSDSATSGSATTDATDWDQMSTD